MQEFDGKVAVITGAASGIGRALADRAANEGMKVVLSDIEKPALQRAAREMRDNGADVLPVPTDVSKADQVERLARETLDAYGAVHLLCNNAGVYNPGPGCTVWESPLQDWQWVIGVNLWGAIHGVHTFVPIMVKQDIACHIVNTASVAGVLSMPYFGVYSATKHAVVNLTETLHRELSLRQTKVHASVLCPGRSRTHIGKSDRNRPAELTPPWPRAFGHRQGELCDR